MAPALVIETVESSFLPIHCNTTHTPQPPQPSSHTLPTQLQTRPHPPHRQSGCRQCRQAGQHCAQRAPPRNCHYGRFPPTDAPDNDYDNEGRPCGGNSGLAILGATGYWCSAPLTHPPALSGGDNNDADWVAHGLSSSGDGSLAASMLPLLLALS